MKRITTFAALAFCVALSGSAHAQGAIEPGTEFPAAPMSKGGLSLAAPSQIIPATPPPPPMAAPVPVSTRKIHRKRRKG